MKMGKYVLLMMVLSAMIACAASNASEAYPEVSKIVVSGQGQVSVAPDEAVIVLGVETRSTNATAAAEENAKTMSQVVEALTGAGVAREEMQTRYSIARIREDELYSERPVPGRFDFVVTNMVTIRMDIVEGLDVARVLDAALAAGANRVDSITFDLKDPAPARAQALKAVVADAQSDAQAIASAAGVGLGRILSITEDYSYEPRAASLAYVSDTPVMAGELEVTASVTVTYEIAQ
jgi:uncharacterized protein YggE